MEKYCVLKSEIKGYACLHTGVFFVDDALVKMFLYKLSIQEYRKQILKGNVIFVRLGTVLLVYAQDRMQREQEIEDIILDSGMHIAIEYARTVIKGEWEELEYKLLNDSKIHPVLLTDYAENVLEGRFILGEEKILADPEACVHYVCDVYPEWEEGIKAISKNAGYSVTYAFRLGRRFEMGEEAIKTDEICRTTYEKTFNIGLLWKNWQ